MIPFPAKLSDATNLGQHCILNLFCAHSSVVQANINPVIMKSANTKEKAHKSGPSAKALAETDLQAVLAKGSGTREKIFGRNGNCGFL